MFEPRSKKLLGAPGITTRSKDATSSSWPYYQELLVARRFKSLNLLYDSLFDTLALLTFSRDSLAPGLAPGVPPDAGAVAAAA